MQIRQIGIEEQAAFERMNTGIEEDYIKRVFSYISETDTLYGAFDGQKMIGLVGYRLFEDRFAVLGRLRVDIAYRKQGIGTSMMKRMLEEVKAKGTMDWVGYATQGDNVPVHRMADALEMRKYDKIFSCVLKEEGMESLLPALRQTHSPIQKWEEVMDTAEIRRFLTSLGRQEDVSLFPYECYYPLPYDERLFSKEYLSQCRLWRSDERFFMLTRDQKGQNYYQLKYFWDDLFNQPQMWEIVLREAKRAERRVWVDASPAAYATIAEPVHSHFDVGEPWYLYGRHL